MRSFKNHRINTFLLLFLFSYIMIGCQKSNVNVSPEGQNKSIEELTIDQDFNYQSWKSIEVFLKLPTSVDHEKSKSRVSIYSKTDRPLGKLVFSAIVDENGEFDENIQVPAYIQQLEIKTIAGDLLVDIDNSENQEFNYMFTGSWSTTAPEDVVDLKTTEVLSSVSSIHKTNYSLSKSTNLVSNGDFELGNLTVLPWWHSDREVDGIWHYVSGAESNASRISEDENYVIKFNSEAGRFQAGLVQAIPVQGGDLLTFQADIKVDPFGSDYNRGSMYLIAQDHKHEPMGRFYYKHIISKNDLDWKTYTHTATVPDGAEYVLVYLYNSLNNGAVYWDNIIVTGPVSDSDGDGVNDVDDDYPNDPLKAYHTIYPNEDDFGTFVFEDNWPGRGDYDFNDLVVDYQYKQTLNANNEILSLDANFIIKAIGASFQNGFGFQLDLDPSLIESVSGISITEQIVNLASNQLELNQEKATIIVTDNVFQQLPHPGGGLGVNTDMNQSYVTPDIVKVKVLFKSGVVASQLGTMPFNPFIFVNGDRSKEVHLPDHPPTSLANTSYFGQDHDDSQIGIGKYYKTENNLPWALDLPASFRYPIEKAAIVATYLHFSEWAESSGTTYPDWYLDKTNYIQDNLVYTKEN